MTALLLSCCVSSLSSVSLSDSLPFSFVFRRGVFVAFYVSSSSRFSHIFCSFFKNEKYEQVNVYLYTILICYTRTPVLVFAVTRQLTFRIYSSVKYYFRSLGHNLKKAMYKFGKKSKANHINLYRYNLYRLYLVNSALESSSIFLLFYN